jgi:hypothetical protein
LNGLPFVSLLPASVCRAKITLKVSPGNTETRLEVALRPYSTVDPECRDDLGPDRGVAVAEFRKRAFPAFKYTPLAAGFAKAQRDMAGT